MSARAAWSRRLRSALRGARLLDGDAPSARLPPLSRAFPSARRAGAHQPWLRVASTRGRARALTASALARGDPPGGGSRAGLDAATSVLSREAREADDEDDDDDDDDAVITPEDVVTQSTRDTADVLRIFKVVRAIRNRGHLSARLDPLGRSLGPLIEGYERMESSVPEDGADIARLLGGYPDGLYLRGRRVNPGQYLGLHDTRPDREFYFGEELVSLDPRRRKRWWTLDEILRRMRAAYCGTMTAEYAHLSAKAKKNWLRYRLEGHARDLVEDPRGSSTSGGASDDDDSSEYSADEYSSGGRHAAARNASTFWRAGGPLDGDVRFASGRWLTRREKRSVLRRLIKADRLERFLGRNFPGAKRFGVEGAESLIPGLQALVECAAEAGTRSIVVGMAHRGRLNILNNVFDKPLAAICTEMKSEGRSDFNVGDVRYHLGTRTVVRVGWDEDEEEEEEDGDDESSYGSLGSRSGRRPPLSMELSMAPNPSHLEAVNAVVAGMVRSKQFRLDPRHRGAKSRRAVCGLVLHGDAAFSGLGANAEAMQLQDLPDYTTGGTIHIIVNNQIGFTTVPRRARSSAHPSDVAKGIGAPILHVNGDDPEAVVRAMRLAVDWRSEWATDVVINLVCYRRLGHNEQDDPSITLPLRTAAIEAQPRVADAYAATLIDQGVVTEAEARRWREACDADFEDQRAKSSEYVETARDWAVSAWQHPTSPSANEHEHEHASASLITPGAEGRSSAEGSPMIVDAETAAPVEGFIVEDGPSGPQARPWDRPSLTTTPHNPRAVATGVALPLLRAIGAAVTELPPAPERVTERGAAASDTTNRSDDDSDDSDDSEDASNAARHAGGLLRSSQLEHRPAPISAAMRSAAEAAGLVPSHEALFPPDFVAHEHTRRLLENRRAMVLPPDEYPSSTDASGSGSSRLSPPGVDWGMAELLAFGSLLLQTDDAKPHCHVRLSGQDVERGTFNHRHSVLYCGRTSRAVNPLDNLGFGRQDRFMVNNSPLSEHAVLGFEYGFSVDQGPAALVLWEAQFGDFANNAQCVVDQFITTGEAKWGQRSGLVLLLPHGYDGQGPDHSSARPERWLAAANDDADSLPGASPRDRDLAEKTFDAIRERGRDVIDLEKFRERVEAREKAAREMMAMGGAGGAAGAGAASGEPRAANLDGADAGDDVVFDEWGGPIEMDDDEDEDEDMLEREEESDSGSDSDSAGSRDGGSSASAPSYARRRLSASRARAARAMFEDVCVFLGRSSGDVDRYAWRRYAKHRARSHSDAAANVVILCPSTPAQYFHALRRQALAPHLKPAVIFAPKFLLHHRPCNSGLGAFAPGTRFRAVIADGDRGDNTKPRDGSGGSAHHKTSDSRVARVVMCSGKLFYALQQARRSKAMEGETALVRIEQLFPFPHEALARRLNRYPDAELVWAQEEPKNMGFWAHVQPRVDCASRELGTGERQKVRRVRYVGRPSAASPATGSPTIHAREMKALVNEALGVTRGSSKFGVGNSMREPV
jgi:2-oxoglutarate dehydrogenase complex dehydrogenase (E1) component-like enzyme